MYIALFLYVYHILRAERRGLTRFMLDVCKEYTATKPHIGAREWQNVEICSRTADKFFQYGLLNKISVLPPFW